MSDQKLTRFAIVSSDKCKPKKCRQECKKSCPVFKTGKLCIEGNTKFLPAESTSSNLTNRLGTDEQGTPVTRGTSKRLVQRLV